MATVLHLRKELARPPVALALAGIDVRTMRVPDDVPVWLALRDRATAELRPRPRRWTELDFASQMLNQPWWRDDRTWLAIAASQRLAGSESPATRSLPAIDSVHPKIVGSVTLAVREATVNNVPVLHWLMVDPSWRRRGIARVLVSHLERAAWNAGWREVQLETHAGWKDAVAFYQSMGYAPVRERSPR